MLGNNNNNNNIRKRYDHAVTLVGFPIFQAEDPLYKLFRYKLKERYPLAAQIYQNRGGVLASIYYYDLQDLEKDQKSNPRIWSFTHGGRTHSIKDVTNSRRIGRITITTTASTKAILNALDVPQPPLAWIDARHRDGKFIYLQEGAESYLKGFGGKESAQIDGVDCPIRVEVYNNAEGGAAAGDKEKQKEAKKTEGAKKDESGDKSTKSGETEQSGKTVEAPPPSTKIDRPWNVVGLPAEANKQPANSASAKTTSGPSEASARSAWDLITPSRAVNDVTSEAASLDNPERTLSTRSSESFGRSIWSVPDNFPGRADTISRSSPDFHSPHAKDDVGPIIMPVTAEPFDEEDGLDESTPLPIEVDEENESRNKPQQIFKQYSSVPTTPMTMGIQPPSQLNHNLQQQLKTAHLLLADLNNHRSSSEDEMQRLRDAVAEKCRDLDTLLNELNDTRRELASTKQRMTDVEQQLLKKDGYELALKERIQERDASARVIEEIGREVEGQRSMLAQALAGRTIIDTLCLSLMNGGHTFAPEVARPGPAIPNFSDILQNCMCDTCRATFQMMHRSKFPGPNPKLTVAQLRSSLAAAYERFDRMARFPPGGWNRRKSESGINGVRTDEPMFANLGDVAMEVALNALAELAPGILGWA
ncbi:uncharacterized protein EV422DRAFT_514164 [Fimicolochytrium jonesii]|uniref:uncharacterized protein n=1 Tax=Fimicolochytrium jonesii TaxID=1396493 RepID=UPI0022FE1A91|nr:uncharacterized protein EV422DRAFT_514164 [Fimicolochytrium jonesii]KAI8825793.1 hypothetical protein EV422DRAFT_514164 [Fimicolochytrium jonesii]